MWLFFVALHKKRLALLKTLGMMRIMLQCSKLQTE